ncbi:MAG: sporulation protein [Polyangiaceae bacterium]
MGLFDKVKSALNAVTGGAAHVQIHYGPQVLFPGEQVELGVSAQSTGQEVRSKGLFIDLSATEIVDFKDDSDNHVRYQEQTFYREIQVAPAFVLGPGETRQFQVKLLVPAEARPSFTGKLCRHQWQIRARVEAFGNDPDTGWIETRVGAR